MKKYLTLKNLGWLLTAIVTFMLGMGGLSKIAGSEEMTTNFTAMNMLPYMALVGVMEVIGVIALCIPRTSIYGALTLSSVMSGAVAVHIAMLQLNFLPSGPPTQMSTEGPVYSPVNRFRPSARLQLS